MELSTIIRLNRDPSLVNPSDLPSGALVYTEYDNSLYYAGGNNGNARAVYLLLINDTNSIGSVTSVEVASTSLKVTGKPIIRSGAYTVDLKPSGVQQGTYGSSGQVPVVSVDQYGRITSVTQAPIIIGGTVKSVSVTSNTLDITGSPVTVNGNITIDMKQTGVKAGTYGSSSAIPIVTVDTYGRLTNIEAIGFEDILGVVHDYTMVGTGTAASPLGLSLRSHLVKDNVTNQLFNANLIIGADSQYASSASARNISIGTSNLTKLNSSIASMSDNVAIGNYSMENATASNRNISIGISAMNGVSSNGNDNTVIGYKALNNVTSPTYSVIIGNEAQNNSSYTTSSYNIVIGSGALAGTKNNVIIGSSAKSASTTDYGSIVIGDSSVGSTHAVSLGASSSAANYAITIGYSSNSVIYGTAIGHNATITATSPSVGSGGVAVGSGSKANDSSVSVGASSNSSGSVFGIAVGADATVSHKYSIAIGYKAATSADYQLAIGSSTSPIGKPDGTGVESYASAGSASALPVTPAAYLRVSLNGTDYKIPLYNV